MAAELQTSPATAEATGTNKRMRKPKHGKGKGPASKRSKRLEAQRSAAAKPKKKPTKKMQKLFQKRARDYHSDSDGGEPAAAPEDSDDEPSEDEAEIDLHDGDSGGGSSSDEREGRRHEITKFVEGCRAFRTAFLKIMKYHLPKDPLGPILSAHKKLIAEKLAEEEAEHKVKGEAAKEKHLAAEKGHVKPESYLDAKEKYLVSVATKGVVKLFNAVNKSQSQQKGLNPSRSKDAKVLAKRRKETFLSEIKKSTTQEAGNPSLFYPSKVPRSTDTGNNEPGWAPLRDGYMLTDSKLKDWDKMPDPAAATDIGQMPMESSSED